MDTSLKDLTDYEALPEDFRELAKKYWTNKGQEEYARGFTEGKEEEVDRGEIDDLEDEVALLKERIEELEEELEEHDSE